MATYEITDVKSNSSQVAKVEVVSKEGAVLKVERIELTEAGKRSLTTRANTLGQVNFTSTPADQPAK